MSILKSLKNYLSKRLGAKETGPESAYDEWAASYDSQPENLMLALDEDLFSSLLNDIEIINKSVADIGCGTGRHWRKILDGSPGKLAGYDVSDGMLNMLRQKYPQAETHRLNDHNLAGLEDNSCDLVISTLTVAHIKNLEEAIQEWCRVLKHGGDMVITDYHPVALAKGATRTFNRNGKTVAIFNHIHSIEKLRKIAKQLQLVEIRLIEKQIDEPMRPFYEKQQAIQLFETWKGVPIIYGIHLKKI